jgi:hypothetical protein
VSEEKRNKASLRHTASHISAGQILQRVAPGVRIQVHPDADRVSLVYSVDEEVAEPGMGVDCAGCSQGCQQGFGSGEMHFSERIAFITGFVVTDGSELLVKILSKVMNIVRFTAESKSDQLTEGEQSRWPKKKE